MLLLPAKKQVDLRPSGKQRFPLPFGRAFFGGLCSPNAVTQNTNIALCMFGQIVALSMGHHQIHISARLSDRKAAHVGKNVGRTHQAGFNHKAATNPRLYQTHSSLYVPSL